jgi:2-hydroxy-6-oxonona-2,4-dienedioate hydrolase
MTLAAEPIRFLEHGRGEAVVLLHGLFGQPENWNPVLEELSDEFRMLAPQLPLERRPTRQPQAFRSIHQLTDHVKRFFDSVGLERATIGGNSLGGQVAIDFCLRYPERVERLIITGSAGLFERSLSGGSIPKVTREFVREKACEVFYDPRFVTEGLIDDVLEMLMDRTYVRFLIRVAKATRDYNVKGELERLKLPTLIVWGQNDKITPPLVAQEFKEHLERAQLVFLDRCGHSPPMEQPEEFSRILRDFLKESVASLSSPSV